MSFEEVKSGHDGLGETQAEGVVSINGNHYVALVEFTDESPIGFELIRKYHSEPYKDKDVAVKAAKDLSYAYRS